MRLLLAAALLPGEPGGVEQDEAEEDGERPGRHPRGEERSEDCSDGGGDLKEHADADAGEAFADVGGGGARGGRDDRDQGRSDGVAEVYVEGQGEEGDENDAASEAGERTQQTRRKGAGKDKRSEELQRHRRLFGLRQVGPRT